MLCCLQGTCTDCLALAAAAGQLAVHHSRTLQEVPNVGFLTFIFVSLIFFAATQDIAVDGWALTLLSHENLSYASTAQTVGLNSGYFLSFTVFLAFNSTEFGWVPLFTCDGQS